MLNSVEIASISTIAPGMPLPLSQCQSNVTGSSYAIGPLDPARVTSLHARLSTGEDTSLLVPAQLPQILLTDPEFKDGYEWGYTDGIYADPDEWTVPQLVNDLHKEFGVIFRENHDPGTAPWTLGLLLGGLSCLAETDRTLALTGIAHLSFLLSLVDGTQPADWPRYESHELLFQHDQAVKAYRKQVRKYREWGKSFDEAQRLAL
jgi:hypothetical protein